MGTMASLIFLSFISSAPSRISISSVLSTPLSCSHAAMSSSDVGDAARLDPLPPEFACIRMRLLSSLRRMRPSSSTPSVLSRIHAMGQAMTKSAASMHHTSGVSAAASRI